MTAQTVMSLVTSMIFEMVSVAVKDAVQGARVKVSAPKAANPAVRAETTIYCYQITPNEGFRNDALALRDASGDQLLQDQVAVDLHYLISFQGDEDYAAERMAEAVIGQLDLFPTINNDVVAKLTNNLLANQPAPPTLQVPIDLTPQYLSLDELSKLWTVFNQVSHRLSVQYVASPVLFIARSPSPIKLATKAHAGIQPKVEYK